MKIPTIKEVVDIIDLVLVPQMEMHIENDKDENQIKRHYDKLGYMYNRGQIDATSNDMELLKNISSQLKEMEK